ncbi:hypothetical protein JCGZ_01671 [Jatropha curcas]|uniref:Uncharacterized protein n=1 Tax=Jatropha curcas TaxID=180498 RepID=A0A067L5Z4_JATCU|nr:hypothetical protein JCGZ_01671 [Jatropha curcas]
MSPATRDRLDEPPSPPPDVSFLSQFGRALPKVTASIAALCNLYRRPPPLEVAFHLFAALVSIAAQESSGSRFDRLSDCLVPLSLRSSEMG